MGQDIGKIMEFFFDISYISLMYKDYRKIVSFVLILEIQIHLRSPHSVTIHYVFNF